MNKYKIHTLKGKTIYPRFYFRWRTMKSRCSSPASREYIRYGARGIFVCEEWKVYKNFHDWCEKTFEHGKSIDRINNDGPYHPDNCRWATPAEQQNNARKTQAKRDAIAVAKVFHVKMLHRVYGDPRTRKFKICSRCKRKKSITKFRKRSGSRSDTHAAYCIPCWREYVRELYKNARQCK